MKILLITFGLFFVCESSYVHAFILTPKPEIISSNFQESIDDGWYHALAITRHKNGNTTKDSVKVKVEIGYVVEIDLGDGINYHSGYNTAGYEYINGQIYFKHLSENKSDVSASVEIKDINGGTNFSIIIENYKSNRISEF